MEMLSKYASMREGVRSNTADRCSINNKPNKAEIERMKFVAKEVFDKVREFCEGPLTCTSFFRSKALNTKIKGSKTSNHMLGAAIDLQLIGGTKTYAEVFHFIKDNLDYSELIWEFGDNKEPRWVHVAYVKGDKGKRTKVAYYDKLGKRRHKPYEEKKK